MLTLRQMRQVEMCATAGLLVFLSMASRSEACTMISGDAKWVGVFDGMVLPVEFVLLQQQGLEDKGFRDRFIAATVPPKSMPNWLPHEQETLPGGLAEIVRPLNVVEPGSYETLDNQDRVLSISISDTLPADSIDAASITALRLISVRSEHSCGLVPRIRNRGAVVSVDLPANPDPDLDGWTAEVLDVSAGDDIPPGRTWLPLGREPESVDVTVDLFAFRPGVPACVQVNIFDPAHKLISSSSVDCDAGCGCTTTPLPSTGQVLLVVAAILIRRRKGTPMDLLGA